MSLRSVLTAIGMAGALASPALAQTSTTWTVTGSWGAAGYARAGDFDGDGKTDIASPNGATAYMKLSTGSGFTSESWIVDGGSTSWAGDSRNVLVGDFDCNGRSEFAIAGVNAGTLDIKFGSPGSDTFTTSSWTISSIAESFDGHAMWGSAGWAFVGDFDGDSCKDDIVTMGVGGTSSHGHVFVGQRTIFGGGTSAFIAAESTMNSTAGSSTWTLPGDFNGDGEEDIASANGANVYMSLGGSLYCSGSCTFGYIFGWSAANWTVSGSWGAAGFARVWDTAADDSIMSPNGTNMYEKLRNSSTSFGSTTHTVNGSWGGASWTFIGDFDGDGDKGDFASANGANVYMKLF